MGEVGDFQPLLQYSIVSAKWSSTVIVTVNHYYSLGNRYELSLGIDIDDLE